MQSNASASSFLGTTPDLVLYNALIHTVNPHQPHASAIALAGERIFAVGDSEMIRALGSSHTRQVDLQGATVLPGFIDAHCHVLYAGIKHLLDVNCDLRTIPAIQSALRERAARTPAGEWVVGFLYDDTKTVERRFLTRTDLDEAAPRHPVVVVHRGGHTVYVNSQAYERAGISETVADPSGGRFERDPQTGRLSGRAAERAIDPFMTAVDIHPTAEQYQQAVKLICGMMNKAGITSVHDMWASPVELAAYQAGRYNGGLSLRLYCMIGYNYLDQMLAAGIQTGLGDDWVRVGGLKLMCDGSISERTAYLAEPYISRPNDHGILVMDEDTLYGYASRAHRAGWQIGTHANGDAAIDITLRVYERLQSEYPRTDPRFRLEHCTMVNDDLIRRIKALGAVPTPFSTYVYFRGEIMAEYGEERLRRMFALRSFLDAGIPVAPGSDYPPGPFEPLMGLQAGVTRADWTGHTWGANQRIRIQEAIRCATLHGAYASFEEKLKGSLEPGKLADLVVLGADPQTVEPMEIINIPVLKTMVGGRWVYEA